MEGILPSDDYNYSNIFSLLSLLKMLVFVLNNSMDYTNTVQYITNNNTFKIIFVLFSVLTAMITLAIMTLFVWRPLSGLIRCNGGRLCLVSAIVGCDCLNWQQLWAVGLTEDTSRLQQLRGVTAPPNTCYYFSRALPWATTCRALAIDNAEHPTPA